jgi:hypothetical protein
MDFAKPTVALAPLALRAFAAGTGSISPEDALNHAGKTHRLAVGPKLSDAAVVWPVGFIVGRAGPILAVVRLAPHQTLAHR